ncbi:conserved hypothetical protein [Crenothrix polyspora]|uniref:Uncharacterized protein n=1 Tax=Crenothrix polyspora TaxID=360316 RepID=A0A1R4HGT3_9GAMM|nr:hypothetical protein [Crenothrix polyspora]SJM95456.1 conserved hypothetical protein [Crenothrix polyspora]
MRTLKKQLAAPSTQVVNISEAREVRALCILLVIQAVVSYRSIPRILNLFKSETDCGLAWIPHFTSVINWTLRLGLGLLKQVKPINTPWLAIIDHSIDIGTKKVLVVLRVPVETLSQKGAALQLKDCECIGLKVCEVVNGPSVAMDLATIFNQAGNPKAIIKDGDATLQKGVRLWSKTQEELIPVIADIGHTMANALKNQFEKTVLYQRFTALTTQGANRLRQTDLAFLIPPKLRSKGRFQSISILGKWGDKMLGVFAVTGRAKKGSLLGRLRIAMPGFLLLKPFIQRFATTTIVVSNVMEILKNKGLDQIIQKQVSDYPLLVSSDIIETLFGNFKHVIERSPQADMNRTTLLIPALCGHLDKASITQALSHASHNDYTIRKKRRAFFKGKGKPNSGESKSCVNG